MKLPTFFILLFILFACTTKKQQKIYTQSQIDSLTQAFNDYIDGKNRDFQTAEWSPLKEVDKSEFAGLKYYPYDATFRFEGPIIPYLQQDSTTVLGSKEGDIRPALKYGYFKFESDGKDHTLDIIKILPRKAGGSSHLFLGFWDETSDHETYGGGRYLDLENTEQENYIIDFNYAYNPYCAYNERYSCAIPPLTNRLDLKLTCGEKIYKEH